MEKIHQSIIAKVIIGQKSHGDMWTFQVFRDSQEGWKFQSIRQPLNLWISLPNQGKENWQTSLCSLGQEDPQSTLRAALQGPAAAALPGPAGLVSLVSPVQRCSPLSFPQEAGFLQGSQVLHPDNVKAVGPEAALSEGDSCSVCTNHNPVSGPVLWLGNKII